MAAEPSEGKTLADTHCDEVQRLVGILSRADNAVAPSEFLASGGSSFQCAGLYGWWADGAGAADLSRALGQPIAPGLIYVGKSVNLWRRIGRQHLGRRRANSTLRRSLGPVIAAAKGYDEIDEPTVTAWMNEHLRVAAIPVATPELLGSIESQVVVALQPPLNIDHLPDSMFRSPLQGLRQAARWGETNRKEADEVKDS